MSTLSPESKAATKVIAKACSWVDHRRAASTATAEEKARQVGRMHKSGDELVEAVEKLRKAGQSGQP